MRIVRFVYHAVAALVMVMLCAVAMVLRLVAGGQSAGRGAGLIQPSEAR